MNKVDEEIQALLQSISELQERSVSESFIPDIDRAARIIEHIVQQIDDGEGS